MGGIPLAIEGVRYAAYHMLGLSVAVLVFSYAV